MQETEQSFRLFNIYNHLRINIFDGKLPEDTVLKIEYRAESDGVYRPGKWDDTQNQKVLDEIKINEKLLILPKEELLTALVHQMIHQWQFHYGSRKTARHYHNREYVQKAASIGLIVEPDSSEQSIDPNGKFMQVSQGLDCELILKPRNVISQSEAKPKSKGKEKYICPECGKIMYGKSGMTDSFCGCNGSWKQMIEQ
ncbi:hypothetical protein NIES2100_70130 [Calothrix sp. NIES-2100]|uniref:SprT-like domain-containing protein n=1 Tax=Calothrix sp. NIES-2100 TaxID=1954172 RepID=UPI000B61F220|nr:hypothetical protein NIES2100_70130 [Calothrix sp. NIES-2100]